MINGIIEDKITKQILFYSNHKLSMDYIAINYTEIAKTHSHIEMQALYQERPKETKRERTQIWSNKKMEELLPYLIRYKLL